jgi:hypothetical protein
VGDGAEGIYGFWRDTYEGQGVNGSSEEVKVG